MHRIIIEQESDVYRATVVAKKVVRSTTLSHLDETKIVITVMELARNIIMHAQKGVVTIRTLESSAIEVTATDEGPGIQNIQQAIQDGFSTGSGLGMGLSGVRRLMDEFHVSNQNKRGTYIRAVKWSRKRREDDGKYRNK